MVCVRLCNNDMLPSLHRLVLRPTGADDAPQNLDDVDTDIDEDYAALDEQRDYQVSVWHERSDAASEPVDVAAMIPASFGTCRMEVRAVTDANPSLPGLDIVTSADELRDRFRDSWNDMDLPIDRWMDGVPEYAPDLTLFYHRSWVVRLNDPLDPTPWTGTINDRDYSHDPNDGKHLILGWMREAMEGTAPSPGPTFLHLDGYNFPAGQEACRVVAARKGRHSESHITCIVGV